MPVSANRIKRAGVTEKISISVDHGDLVILRRRARKLYGGNLSAAVVEGVRHIREQEGREALVAWLGHTGEATEAQRKALRDEWQAPGRTSRGGRPRQR